MKVFSRALLNVVIAPLLIANAWASGNQSTQSVPAVPPVPAPAPAVPRPGATRLTLPEAEQLVLKNNPRVAQAEFRAKAYDEITGEFQSAFFPTLQGNITAVGADSGSRLAAGALNNPIVYSRLGTGLSVNQLITDFGRTRNLVQSASINAQAEREAINYSKADLLLQTDAAYFAILRARALLTVARETIKTRQDVADQVKALFQSKLKSSLDLSFANVNVADAKLLLSTAENDVRAAEAQLSRLLTFPNDTRFELVDPKTSGNAPQDSGNFIQQALQKRPDLLRVRLQLQSSEKTAQAEKLLSRPTVGLSGTAGYAPVREDSITSRYGAIGLNVSIPIFNGGLFRARRFEAESRYAAEQKAVQDLELQIQRDVRIAWLNATNAFERVGLTQQLLDQSRLALDLAQSRYSLGLSSIIELSQSQLQYTSAEIAQARAKYDYSAQVSILNYQAGLLL